MINPPHRDVKLAMRVQVWHLTEAARSRIKVEKDPALDIDKHPYDCATPATRTLAARDGP